MTVKESRDGAVVRALASHQYGPGSIPGLARLAPSVFSPGTPVSHLLKDQYFELKFD